MAKVVLAFDSFKDTLSASELCAIAKEKLLSLDPSLDILCLPMSDGGEGFLKTFELAVSDVPHFSFSSKQLEVIGPLGTPLHVTTRQAEYGILYRPEGNLGVIEMARASGIEFVEAATRNPEITTSHGTGQLLRHLIENEGVLEVLLGVGGTCTVDCGLGVLYGLGSFQWEFEGPDPIYFTGGDLKRLKRLHKHDNLNDDVKITIACDVMNPLLGPTGAAYVYGPQKGLKQDCMENYEADMARGKRTSQLQSF